MENADQRFIPVRRDLLEKGLRSSTMTGEEMRVFVAYFIAGGNKKMISELTDLPVERVEEKIFELGKRGYLS
ncbi:MAG: hypothetical protein JRJ29_22525 [Deltaproteobacteria bacterium]|nr:hypothetical protein [Deltaproteobacteria bacterium]